MCEGRTMVQNVSNQNPYGSIDRVGMTQDGRVVYKVTDGNGEIAGGLSVAQKDCDMFERSYRDVMEAAPKLEQYMKTHTEEDMKRQQKRGRWIIGGSALIGGLIPALTSHFITQKTVWQALMTLAGTVAGLFVGIKVGTKAMTPPGAEQMTRATQTLSKLDIQQI